MSLATPSQSGVTGSAGITSDGSPERIREACPLCAAPLHHEQEWCLNCGAAARTRLAASPGWKAPLLALVVVLVLSLGVLAGSLVKLAGGSGTQATQTTTVTATSAATTTTQSAIAPQTTPTTATTTTSTTATQAHGGAGADTTSTPAGFAIAPSVKVTGKVKGKFGGINLTHLKKSIAERLSKLGRTSK